MNAAPIAFIDLKAQRDRIREQIDAAITGVVEHGAFILGPEVEEFEASLAEYTGARHVVTCANGTDALQLALMAKEIGPGDAVFVPSFTFVATAEAAVLVGATPVFVDVRPDSFNMDPVSLEAAIDAVAVTDLAPKAVIPVDLFGQPADYSAIKAVADRHGLTVVADAAQSLGGSLHNRRVGSLAELTTTSFFPAKPLGCYGDGGAVMTDDDGLADTLRSLRFHGKGSNKYDNVRIGMNSRLDTIQAAILTEKMVIFADELDARDRITRRYSEALADVAQVPVLMAGARSAWAQYTIRVRNRDHIADALRKKGVPVAIHYPRPLHTQAPYRAFPTPTSGVPVAERLAGEVLSLPMHPYLDETTQSRIVDALRNAIGGNP